MNVSLLSTTGSSDDGWSYLVAPVSPLCVVVVGSLSLVLLPGRRERVLGGVRGVARGMLLLLQLHGQCQAAHVCVCRGGAGGEGGRGGGGSEGGRGGEGEVVRVGEEGEAVRVGEEGRGGGEVGEEGEAVRVGEEGRGRQ